MPLGCACNAGESGKLGEELELIGFGIEMNFGFGEFWDRNEFW